MMTWHSTLQIGVINIESICTTIVGVEYIKCMSPLMHNNESALIGG